MTLIMGIETSCDETAIAFVENGKNIIYSNVYSQLIHSKYGGVVPDISSREHVKYIDKVYNDVLNDITPNTIDYIAVVNGPGLIVSLMAGVMFAKGYAMTLKKDTIPINHIIAHIYAIELSNETVQYPLIALTVSGGHTSLFLVDKDYKDIKEIGKTRDDAAGEAFDKCAKMLSLSYPGGPVIDKLSKEGDRNFHKFPVSDIENFDFSFSGLKTSVMYYIKKHSKDFIKDNTNNICASLQEAITEQLINKLIQASKFYNIKNIAIVGGVGANSRLREKAKLYADRNNLKLFLSKINLCTDNAANVAGLAYKFLNNKHSTIDINVFARN